MTVIQSVFHEPGAWTLPESLWEIKNPEPNLLSSKAVCIVYRLKEKNTEDTEEKLVALAFARNC